MAGFRVDFFKGLRPRLSKTKLPIGEAQTAQNVKLGNADLEPLYEPSLTQTVTDGTGNRTIYLYKNTLTSGGETDTVEQWFEWDKFVDVALGPIKGDSLDRIYYTGDGVPKITWNALQTSQPYPTISYDLGIPQPTTRLTAVGSDLPESTGSEDRRTAAITTTQFEIQEIIYTLYPGTGTESDTWEPTAASVTTSDIIFDLKVGDTMVVLEVLDGNNVKVGGDANTGAFAATQAATGTGNSWTFTEVSNTKIGGFGGWRIPDGAQLQITSHGLRVGDVLRVTQLDDPVGLRYKSENTTDHFELADNGTAGSWGVATADPVYGDGYPRHFNKRLGANAAGTANFTLTGGFYYEIDRGAADTTTIEDRSYVYTYVSSIGEEGPPSEPSTIIETLDGDAITLTGFDLGPEGNRDIDRIRIYRTNSTAIGTEFQFVTTVPFTSIQTAGGAVIDNVLGVNLGEILQTATWFPPDPEMQGITSMPNGMMVGFKDKNIYFSEPYQPHAWPPEYDQAVDYRIVGLAPFGNSVAVLTTGTPYVITGSHPRNANVRPYKINQACLYKESIATANDRVYYASPDGLVEIGVNGARIVTEPYTWKAEWAQFEPETMVGEFHDGKYFGFFGADNTVLPQPTGSVAVTGTIFDGTNESDIVAGGKTIILTLTGDTWKAAGTAFDDVRTNIIFGITGSSSELLAWNNNRSVIPVTDVVRTSDTVVTITLSALPDYAIAADESLTFKAPAVALTGAVALTAPEQAIIFQERLYSASMVIACDASTTDDLPSLIFTEGNITDWKRVEAPTDEVAADTVDYVGAAYNKFDQVWVVAGTKTTGTNAGDLYLISAEGQNGLQTENWVKRSVPTSVSGESASALIFDHMSRRFWLGLTNNKLLFSLNGKDWTLGSMPASTAGLALKEFALASAEPSIFGCFTTGTKIVKSQSLFNPLTNVWTDLGDVGFATGTAVNAMTSGAGKVLVASNDASAEIGYYDHNGTTYTSIGTLAMTVASLAFGANRFVAISPTGQVSYVDAGSVTTIGSWSTPSGAIDGVGTRDTAVIEFDAGAKQEVLGFPYNGFPGFSFIACLSNSATPGDIVSYTSTDAITWTLRDTDSNASVANDIGVSHPETDLGTVTVTPTGVSLNNITRTAESFVEGDDVGCFVKIRNDGYVETYSTRNGFVVSQRFVHADTDWIIPHYDADNTYEFRMTNVITGNFDDFPAGSGTGGVGGWVALGTGLTWGVEVINFGNAWVRCTLQVRQSGGAVLDECTVSLDANNTGLR